MPENEELEAITVAEVKEFLNFLDRVEEVKFVRLQPGDVIVCKTDDRVTAEVAERVQSALTRVFPGHEVLITSNCSIEVGRPELIDGSVALDPECGDGTNLRRAVEHLEQRNDDA